MTIRCAVGFILLCCTPLRLVSQESLPDTLLRPQPGRLVIAADEDSCLVYLDTLLVGRTPCVLDSIAPGQHTVRVVYHVLDSWFGSTVADTVVLREGETKVLNVVVRHALSVFSQPDGAELFIDDSSAGQTPVLVRTSRLNPGSVLTVRKPGYPPASLRADEIAGPVVTLPLGSGWDPRLADHSPLMTNNGMWTSRTVGLSVSGGVAVVAGIAAAYFKISADERQEAFEQTGNQAILADRRRLDTWAGISFAITQLSLVLFSYLLLSE